MRCFLKHHVIGCQPGYLIYLDALMRFSIGSNGDDLTNLHALNDFVERETFKSAHPDELIDTIKE